MPMEQKVDANTNKALRTLTCKSNGLFQATKRPSQNETKDRVFDCCIEGTPATRCFQRSAYNTTKIASNTNEALRDHTCDRSEIFWHHHTRTKVFHKIEHLVVVFYHFSEKFASKSVCSPHGRCHRVMIEDFCNFFVKFERKRQKCQEKQDLKSKKKRHAMRSTYNLTGLNSGVLASKVTVDTLLLETKNTQLLATVDTQDQLLQQPWLLL